MGWKFTATEPSLPEYQFTARELELWNALQTNSRRAMYRKGRWGKPPKRNMPRYDLVYRLKSELRWGENEIYDAWVRMKSKCQAERKAIEG
jgi:hypothetical protein